MLLLFIHLNGIYSGAGVTVSWGCAKHVVTLLEDWNAAKEGKVLASKL